MFAAILEISSGAILVLDLEGRYQSSFAKMESGRSIYDRQCLDETALRSSVLLLQRPDGITLRYAGEVFATSKYVQHVAKYSEEKKAHIIATADTEVFQDATEEPTTLEDFLNRTLKAWDFLIMQPSGRAIARCIEGVVVGLVQQIKDLRCFEVLLLETRLEKPTWFTWTDSEAIDVSAAYDNEERPLKKQRVHCRSDWEGSIDAVPNVSVSLVKDFVEAIYAFAGKTGCYPLQDPKDGRLNHYMHPSMDKAINYVFGVALRLCNTVEGSKEVLKSVDWLVTRLHLDYVSIFIHKAFCCLYIAEQHFAKKDRPSGRMTECFLSLDVVFTLQKYYISKKLDLGCFVPKTRSEDLTFAAGQASYIIPGLMGNADVPVLFPDSGAVFSQACEEVPWLATALGGDIVLHLTGSFLCFMRGKSISPLQGSGPGDVDIFCLRDEDLDAARRQVETAMLGWAIKQNEDARVKSWPRPLTKSRGYVFEVEGLCDVPHYACRCDLYINCPELVMAYHLPQVRAYMTASPTPMLHLSPSCAIAWITMLNIDFEYFSSRTKTPFDVIKARWLNGFTLLTTGCNASTLNGALKRNMSPAIYKVRTKSQTEPWLFVAPDYWDVVPIEAEVDLNEL